MPRSWLWCVRFGVWTRGFRSLTATVSCVNIGYAVLSYVVPEAWGVFFGCAAFGILGWLVSLCYGISLGHSLWHYQQRWPARFDSLCERLGGDER